jgi:hypothetical protein
MKKIIGCNLPPILHGEVDTYQISAIRVGGAHYVVGFFLLLNLMWFLFGH